jgi:hypothetical protein
MSFTPSGGPKSLVTKAIQERYHETLLMLLEFQLYHCSLFPRTSRLFRLEDGGNVGGDEEDDKDLNNMPDFITRKHARNGVNKQQG